MKCLIRLPVRACCMMRVARCVLRVACCAKDVPKLSVSFAFATCAPSYQFEPSFPVLTKKRTHRTVRLTRSGKDSEVPGRLRLGLRIGRCAARRAAGGAALGDGRATGILGFLHAALVELLVLGKLCLLALVVALLEHRQAALVVQALRRDQPLDLGRLVRVLARLGLELATDDKLAHVVLLGQVEELADVVRPLRPEAAGHLVVGEVGDVLRALLDDHQVEHREVAAHDAAAHGLALALAGPALAVAGVALGQQQANPVVGKHALLHGEALLVVAAGDAEDVALKLVPQLITCALRTQARKEQGRYVYIERLGFELRTLQALSLLSLSLSPPTVVDAILLLLLLLAIPGHTPVPLRRRRGSPRARTFHLLCHPPVVEDPQLALVVHVDALLLPRHGTRDVDLHPVSGWPAALRPNITGEIAPQLRDSLTPLSVASGGTKGSTVYVSQITQ
eukprot:scaffold5532_cov263-Pinguiococcus_pyrenoidosus.AAC.7